MASYSTVVLTQQGQALYAKAQTGTQLNFTRMQIGSGQLASGQDPTTLTALITPIEFFNINSESSSGNTAYVKGIFENTNITTSTYTCELGLFAQDPTAGEILYAYANAGTQGDTIPPYSEGPISKQYQINVAIGNATNVTATIPAETYIPTSQIGVANGVSDLDANGQVPASRLGNVPPLPSDLAKLDVAQTWTANQIFGANNQNVFKTNAIIERVDTRSSTLTYNSDGTVSQVVEKDGTTTVKTTGYTYTNGNLTQVQEVVDGNTITTTLTYDANNNLTGTSRAVA